MPCSGTRCYPAIDWALQGSQKQEALSTKFCNWVDLVALIRNQITLDLAAGETANTATTAALAAELVAQLDNESNVYTALDGVSGTADTANEFGLVCEINCKLLNVLVRDCNTTENTVNLGALAVAGDVTYEGNVDDYTQFLCCVADHFRAIQSFLERFVQAKRCEVPC